VKSIYKSYGPYPECRGNGEVPNKDWLTSPSAFRFIPCPTCDGNGIIKLFSFQDTDFSADFDD